MTNNPWRLWRIINPCSHPDIILTNSGSDIVPKLQCAQLLHDVSCSVFTCERVTTCPHLPTRPNMSEIVINESGILPLLKRLRTSSTTDHKKFNNKLLKNASQGLSRVLSTLFTQSLSTGYITQDW